MTAAAAGASYRRMMTDRGETVALRRYSGSGPDRPWFDAEARAVVSGYRPEELAEGIVQGDQKLIVLAEDLVAAQFPLPLLKGDKAIVRGRMLNIEAADGNTRRVAGVLIAWELQVRG